MNKYCEQWFCCCCYSNDAQLYLECNRLIRTVWTAVSHTLDVPRGCLGNTLWRIYIFFSKFSISFRSAWFNSIKYQINTFTFPTFVLIVWSEFFSCFLSSVYFLFCSSYNFFLWLTLFILFLLFFRFSYRWIKVVLSVYRYAFHTQTHKKYTFRSFFFSIYIYFLRTEMR